MQQEIVGVYGRPVSRVVKRNPIRDDITGEVYPCAATFAKAKGVSPYTVYSILINNGSTKNVGIGKGNWERTPTPYQVGPYLFKGGKRHLAEVLGHQKGYYYNLVCKTGSVEAAEARLIKKLDKMSRERKLPADIDPEEKLRQMMEEDAKRIRERQVLIRTLEQGDRPETFRKYRDGTDAATTARLRYVLDGVVTSVNDLSKKLGIGPFTLRTMLVNAREVGNDHLEVDGRRITWVKI